MHTIIHFNLLYHPSSEHTRFISCVRDYSVYILAWKSCKIQWNVNSTLTRAFEFRLKFHRIAQDFYASQFRYSSRNKCVKIQWYFSFKFLANFSMNHFKLCHFNFLIECFHILRGINWNVRMHQIHLKHTINTKNQSKSSAIFTKSLCESTVSCSNQVNGYFSKRKCFVRTFNGW